MPHGGPGVEALVGPGVVPFLGGWGEGRNPLRELSAVAAAFIPREGPVPVSWGRRDCGLAGKVTSALVSVTRPCDRSS